MADIFNHMNEANLQLQGANVTLIDAKRVVSTHIQKMVLYKTNISRRSFQQFPVLAQTLRDIHEEPHDDELMVYAAHIEKMTCDLKVGCQYYMSMKYPLNSIK
jgi:hypothetical protein